MLARINTLSGDFFTVDADRRAEPVVSARSGDDR